MLVMLLSLLSLLCLLLLAFGVARAVLRLAVIVVHSIEFGVLAVLRCLSLLARYCFIGLVPAVAMPLSPSISGVPWP